VELDVNTQGDRYEVRLIDWQGVTLADPTFVATDTTDWIRDFRQQSVTNHPFAETTDAPQFIWLKQCPRQIEDLYPAYRQSLAVHLPLALAYDASPPLPPEQWWLQLVGQVKYLARTQLAIAKQTWQQQWKLSETTLPLAIIALADLGFSTKEQGEKLYFKQLGTPASTIDISYQTLIKVHQEEQFKQQFFCQVPIAVLQEILTQNPLSPSLVSPSNGS